MLKRSRPFTYLVLIVVLVGGLILTWSISGSQQAPSLNYSDLISRAQAGQIAKLTISGTEATAIDKSGKQYSVQLPASTGTLAQELTADKVDVSYQSNSGTLGYVVASLLPSLIFLLLIGGFMFYMFRQTQSGNNQAMSFGRSRARMIAGDKPQVTFPDVAGVDEAKQELTEVVEFLKYPEKFVALGARIPKGVLMVGPPGTGKTLLSKAVAGEAGVPFFNISGSEFVEMFVGVGASRVRDLFDQARRTRPASSSSTRSTPSAATAAPASAVVTTNANRL